MQKKLIALAVAGLVSAPAFAQSNVTVYGRMDIGVASKDDVNGNSVTVVDNSLWTTSRLGFKGSEDLGNGLKAIFQIESRLRNDGDSDLNTNRDTFVGLTGGFGTLIAGRNSTPLNNWLADYNPNKTANSFETTNVNLAVDMEVRVSNSVVYAAPKMGGIDAAVLYAPDENDGVKNDIYGIGLQYTGGPLAAFFTWHAQDNVADSYAVGLSYDLGVARLMGTYILNSFDASGLDDEKGWSLGVDAPIGAGSIGLGYTAETDIGGLDGADIDTYALTYKHNLSKRTYAYTGYQRQDPDGGDAIDTFGVGIAHSF